jgi:Ca2+-binding RTX toxin-like protein
LQQALLKGTGSRTYYIDGVEVTEAPTPADMHQRVYLLANLAVGGAGSWPGVADPSAFPAAMTVDYIRVCLNDVTTLYGTSGPDLLAGGAGANTLIGRTGDDSYLVDNVGDGVIENAAKALILSFRLSTYGCQRMLNIWCCKAAPICRATAMLRRIRSTVTPATTCSTAAAVLMC